MQDIKDSYNELDDYKNILNKMIQLRFNLDNQEEELNQIKFLAKKMVWLESNSEYIAILLNIYQKLSHNIKNLYNKIDKIISGGEIKMEISERSPEWAKEINAPFFYIMDSLLKVITSDFDFKSLKEQEFYDFINLLKGICQDILRIVNELGVFSGEVFTIQEFLSIEEKLNNVNESKIENILKILEILSNHTKFANDIICDQKKYKELSDNIQVLYSFLKEKLGETDHFTELILNIFLDEIKKIENENYHKTLIDIILANPKLISKSYNLMSFILKALVNDTPDKIINNIDEIKNKNNLSLQSICNTNNDCLNEIIIKIFENQFNCYFDSLENLNPEEYQHCLNKFFESLKSEKFNPTTILFDNNLELFKKCLFFLEEVYEKKDEKINNEHIIILYCIAYIKIYLYKCIYFNHNNNQEFIGFDEIYKVIIGNAKNNFRRMIKIYIFKIFFYLLNNNYQDFSNYHYPNHQIEFFNDFKEKFNEKIEAMLNYYLLPRGEEYEKYKEEVETFESYRFADFGNPVKKFKEYVENHGIDIFYTISSNIIISNLALKNYVADNTEYSKYSSFAKNLFNQLNLPEATKQLFLLFSNDNTFEKVMKPKLLNEEGLIEIDPISFEVLLYSLRFCLQTANRENSNGFLYSELLDKNAEQKIKENVLPGNNISDDVFINGYYDVVNHLNTLGSNYGAYVCSCGVYYRIDPCGFSNQSSTCANCKLPIGNQPGAGSHTLAKRNGHFRIFKDQNAKNGEMSKYGDTDERTPNMLLADFKAKLIDPKIEALKFGISKIKQIMFEDVKQNVRKLSIVGYRLLNFILYSHLFFSNCLGNIKNENMKQYVCDGMTCLKMIVKDWNLLKDALQSKGIQIIQIFLNMIFRKLCEKLINCKEIKTSEEREKFEEEIEKLLEESYKEYENYSKEYLELNQEALKLDKHNMKSLMLENNEIKAYDEENYPYYKFFLMTTYPTKESFINEIGKVIQYKAKYPLLSLYISNLDNKQIRLLKYLPHFNDFVNFMIDTYSYQLSREEASKKLLKDEEIYNDKKFKEKFNEFKKIWKELKPFATKYGCRDEMPSETLDESKSLAYFLNDNGEIGKGMYIAAALQNFIEWQNQFLDGLIEPLRQNGILHHFVKYMEKTIDVQNAKKNEALNIELLDDDFMSTIYENCKRNIFREDNSINFMNYKQYIYDFDSIEKIFGQILLPGKVKFNNHEKLKFVTYCFEGFRGNKSSVLSDFQGKYNQKPLDLENKQLIYESIKDKLEEHIEDLSKILFSIQLLIYYLTQERKVETTEIKVVIDELPDYVNLSNECKDFLSKQKFKIQELVDVYSYIELICFKPIADNLLDHYKKKIDEKKGEKILNLFNENKITAFKKVDLATACRKLISRYLVSTRNDTDYSENNKLDLYLDREELWSGIWEGNEEKIKTDLEILRKEELTLGHTYELYKLLGGDENKIMENIKIKNDEEEEKEKKDNINDEGEVEKIKKKGKKRKKY